MSMITISHNLKGISAGEAYEAAVEQLPDLGYIIWKTRPLAWLAIANRELPEGRVNANVSFRPGDGAVLTISLSSETIGETALQDLGTELGEAILSLFA